MKISDSKFQKLMKTMLYKEYGLKLNNDEIYSVFHCYNNLLLELLRNEHSISFVNFGNYSLRKNNRTIGDRRDSKIHFAQSRNLDFNWRYKGQEKIYYVIYFFKIKEIFQKRTFDSIRKVFVFLEKNFDTETAAYANVMLKKLRPGESYVTDDFDIRISKK